MSGTSKTIAIPAIPTNARGAAPPRAGGTGARKDRARVRRMWGLIALVTALSAGLGAAIDMRPRRPLAGGTAPGPIPERGPSVGHPAGAVASALSRASPPDPRGPTPRENEPVVDAGKSHDRQPADGQARRPAAEPAGAPPPAAVDPVSLGRELFAREWLVNDPRCHGGDGLGPVYNATSCLQCHGQGGPGGAGPASRNVELVTGVGYIVRPEVPLVTSRINVSGNVGDGPDGALDVHMSPDRADLVKVHPGFRDARSAVLHRYGVAPEYDRWRQGVVAERRFYRHVLCEFRDTGLMIAKSARNPLPLFGAGLIDALPDAALENAVRRQPPRIQGRVHRMKDGRIGRFGWKAQVATLQDFVLTACANELGLEVPDHHQAASPLDPDAKAARPDLTQEECDALVAYVRSLPPPGVRDPSGPRGSADIPKGRELFHSIGCADCHTPSLGTIRGMYSDLLLHEMGASLSDPGDYYDSDEPGSLDAPKNSEWRTPPLWGFRDSGPYLHDGRARTLEEAVALHGGQGADSARRFRALIAVGRAQVEAFLNSLVAPGAADSPRVPSAPEAEVRTDPHAVEVTRPDAAAARNAATELHADQTPDKRGQSRGPLDVDREAVREVPDPLPGGTAAGRRSMLGETSARSPRERGAGVTGPVADDGEGVESRDESPVRVDPERRPPGTAGRLGRSRVRHRIGPASAIDRLPTATRPRRQ